MRTWERLTLAAVLTLLFTVTIALLGFGIYGWTLFVLIPGLLGATVAFVFRPSTVWRAVGLSAGASAAAGILLFLVNVEGAICILMALPLITLAGAVGALLVHRTQATETVERGTTLLLLLPIATMGWDIRAAAPEFEVRTQIVVHATPEQVWNHVVAFSELPEPGESYFRAGVAYPKRARIVGYGPGAIRYCEFSTGSFVEPIEVWDAPRLLQFRVTENPPPLREWGLLSEIRPKHLQGYLVSKAGRFQLTSLENNDTLLEGVTRYQHGLWPAQYWRVWSDAIIHRIHLRVLNHVRVLAEQEAERGW